jgi:predicted AAA+ superfamily ATPase
LPNSICISTINDRHATPAIEAAFADTPVVFVDGPRQCGKSTLVQALAARRPPMRYLTLDDASVLAAARADPVGFLAALDGPSVIDEVQRAPELFLPLKAAVDRDRRPGRFLLTGSADALLLPHLADALVGRMERVTLWPFSQGERAGTREDFLAAVFADTLPPLAYATDARADVVERVLAGGFPEALARKGSRRAAWFGSYITTLLQRDVRDLARVSALHELPRLLTLLATRTAQPHNLADHSRALGMPHTTLQRHLALLEATYLVQRVPAWSPNLGKRLVRAPKVVVVDSGVAAWLQGLDAERLRQQPHVFGPLLEAFVGMELRKQLGWTRHRATVHHYRSHAGAEVDLVLEDAAGRVVGIEVKAAATVGLADFRGLKALQADLGERWLRGVVLYLGDVVLPFGDRRVAMPVSAIWRATSA